MTGPAAVLAAGKPAGAGGASIVPLPGLPSPQLAEGSSGLQRAAGRSLKQMARGRLAGRRQDLGPSTAADAPAAVVR